MLIRDLDTCFSQLHREANGQSYGPAKRGQWTVVEMKFKGVSSLDGLCILVHYEHFMLM